MFSHICPTVVPTANGSMDDFEAGPRSRRATGFGDQDQARARRAQVERGSVTDGAGFTGWTGEFHPGFNMKISHDFIKQHWDLSGG